MWNDILGQPEAAAVVKEKNLRRYIAVALLVLLAVGVASVAQADPTADKSGKFTLEIIAGWTQNESTDLFSIIAPNKIAQLSISSEAVPAEVTLALFQSVYVKQMKQALKSFALVSKGNTTVAGTPAGVWVYTGVADGVKLKFKNVVMFKGGTMYNVVMPTLPNLYKKDVEGMDKMLASWKWL